MMSLQENCFKTIIENFEALHSYYTAAESFSDKLGYEFLQRKYSRELAEELHRNESLHQKYIDLVFSKFLKFFDTTWVRQFDRTSVCKIFSEIGPCFEEVHFNGGFLSTQVPELICKLSNLKYVTFAMLYDDLSLYHISKYCPNIQSIKITFLHPSVSSNALKLLYCQDDGAYACPDLREITIRDSISANEIDKEVVANLLQKFTKLENFECASLVAKSLYSLHKDEMHALNNTKPYNLTILDLRYYISRSDYYNKDIDDLRKNLDDLLEICVAVCPNIVWLESYVFSQTHINLCLKFPLLQKLTLLLNDELSGYLDLDNFLKIKGNMLTFLKIHYISFTTKFLLNCSNLNVLHINVEDLKDLGEYPVNHSLKELCLTIDNLKRNPRGIHHFDDETNYQISIREASCLLSSLPNLERLCIQGTELKNNCKNFSLEIRAAILKCCTESKLQHIAFILQSFDIQLMEDILSTCKTLKTLTFYPTGISPLFPDITLRLQDTARTLPNKPIISGGCIPPWIS